MKIVLATHNQHKIQELKAIFERHYSNRHTFVSMKEAGFEGEIDESGKTFEENAKIKAVTVCNKTGLVTFADDSGLEVEALNGRPGVYSSRYGGENTGYGEKIKLLLSELENIPDEKRKAKFVSVFCCAFPDGRECIIARGECEGIIIRKPRGEGTFGYDPVFYYPPFGRTFAELTIEEKNKISHRGLAVEKFIKMLCLDK